MNLSNFLFAILVRTYQNHEITLVIYEQRKRFELKMIPKVNAGIAIIVNFDNLNEMLEFIFSLLKKQKLTSKEIFELTCDIINHKMNYETE